jgi:hypothetical protein
MFDNHFFCENFIFLKIHHSDLTKPYFLFPDLLICWLTFAFPTGLSLLNSSINAVTQECENEA